MASSILTASAFSRLGQYTSTGPTYCYAELAVSSLAVAVQMDGCQDP